MPMSGMSSCWEACWGACSRSWAIAGPPSESDATIPMAGPGERSSSATGPGRWSERRLGGEWRRLGRAPGRRCPRRTQEIFDREQDRPETSEAGRRPHDPPELCRGEGNHQEADDHDACEEERLPPDRSTHVPSYATRNGMNTSHATTNAPGIVRIHA